MKMQIIFQIFLNALSISALYIISAIGIKLIYTTSKFINISTAFFFVLSPYILIYLYSNFEINLLLSIIISIIFSIGSALLIYLLIFQKLIFKSALILLITSIGVYIVLQSFISIIFGEDVRTIKIAELKSGISFLGARLSYLKLYGILLSIIVVILTFFTGKSKIGLKFKAVSSNRNLAQVFGVRFRTIVILATVFGVILVSSAGILIALDIGVTPHSGFNLFIFALVAIIIGGTEKLRGLIIAALFIAIAQNFAAYYIDSMWKDSIVYVILVFFLLWKPLGISGWKLKKTEL